MNIRLKLPRRKPARQNPQWLLNAAHWVGKQRRRIEHYTRLRRTGLHMRACLWCAWNTR